MSELKTVDLSRIDANPFRDIESYPFDESKIDRLTESINSTGFWPSVIVRLHESGRYQCSFGHHRLRAAERAGVKAAHVVVQDLDDDKMLRMMVDENATEYGHDFFTILNSVSAVVRAYGMGAIELDEPAPRTDLSQLRVAPGVGPTDGRKYTDKSVANWLGWSVSGGKGKTEPSVRVKIALSALELIEREILKLEQFRSVTQTQAKVLVDVTRARMRAERADTDATIKVREDARKLAKKSGDTNKVESLTASIEDLTTEAETKAAKAGRAAAKKVTEDFKPKPISDVVRDAGPKSTGTETRAVKTATQVLYDLIAKWEVMCLELDPKWEKTGDASPASKKAAKVALLALSERAKNRAGEC